MMQKENTCFVCGTALTKTIHAKEVTMHCCSNCGAQWQWPLQEEKTYEHLYSDAYYKKIWGWSEATDTHVGKSKYFTSKKFIKLLHSYKKGGKVLDIGCGLGYLLSFLQQDNYGYDVYGLELSHFAKTISEKRIGKGKIFKTVEELKKKKLRFDAILFFDSMEHIPDQDKLFDDLDMLLAPFGKVFVIMPDASSFSAKVMGKHWIEYKKDHVLFYGKKALRIQLEKKGYTMLECYSSWKTVTLYYLIHYLSVFRIPVISSFFERLEKILPSFVLNISLSFPIGQMTCVFERRGST